MGGTVRDDRPRAVGGARPRMAKLVHSMIRVLDEERSLRFYREALGLGVAERLDFEEFTLLYLSNGESEFELELTVNKGRTTPYDVGKGYGHIAVVVDDLDAEHARMAAAGLAPRKVVEFGLDGRVVARFFFVADPDGYQIEVIQRGGRFK
jgi:lactoylglutathione lyase